MSQSVSRSLAPPDPRPLRGPVVQMSCFSIFSQLTAFGLLMSSNSVATDGRLASVLELNPGLALLNIGSAPEGHPDSHQCFISYVSSKVVIVLGCLHFSNSSASHYSELQKGNVYFCYGFCY